MEVEVVTLRLVDEEFLVDAFPCTIIVRVLTFASRDIMPALPY
jgi:hypothetical protein